MMMILSSIVDSYSIRHGRSCMVSLLRCNHRASILDSNQEGIHRSASVLKEGGLVAFPTETVYGLGANALNETSVLSIFKAKRRPLTDPLIVHVASKDDIVKLFDFNDITHNNDNNDKKKLALTVCNVLCDAFWPGPLTIIYKASTSIPSCVTAGTGKQYN